MKGTWWTLADLNERNGRDARGARVQLPLTATSHSTTEVVHISFRNAGAQEKRTRDSTCSCTDRVVDRLHKLVSLLALHLRRRCTYLSPRVQCAHPPRNIPVSEHLRSMGFLCFEAETGTRHHTGPHGGSCPDGRVDVRGGDRVAGLVGNLD